MIVSCAMMLMTTIMIIYLWRRSAFITLIHDAFGLNALVCGGSGGTHTPQLEGPERNCPLPMANNIGDT
jgi:hypothetical protein